MTVSEQKKQLRAQVRAAERSLSREERAQSDRLIVTHVLSLPEYQAARSLFCFVGTSREIDTTAILQDALRRGTILCVPLCTSPGKMELRRIKYLEQLRPGAYGNLEPVPNTTRLDLSCVELSIIPCISCDHLGHRLGQGGGYYDRLFSAGADRCVLLCREALVRIPIPCEAHDVVFPMVITETGVYRPGQTGDSRSTL